MPQRTGVGGGYSFLKRRAVYTTVPTVAETVTPNPDLIRYDLLPNTCPKLPSTRTTGLHPTPPLEARKLQNRQNTQTS